MYPYRPPRPLRRRRSSPVRWLRRHPVAYWSAAVVLLAVAVGADPSTAPTTTSLAVAARDLDPGAVIGPDDVTTRPAAVAAGAPVDDPVGRTVRHPILAGEPVVAERLVGGSGRGPTALLAEGQAAVAVPVEPGTPPVGPGQVVDILAVRGFDGSGPAEPLARSATVLAADDEQVLLAVGATSAPAVAASLARDVVVLVVVP